MLKKFSILILVLFMVSCSSNDDSSEPENNGETASTITEITTISNSSATINATAQGASISAKGVVLSTSSNPTLENSENLNQGAGVGNYTSVITELISNTQYFVRAYSTDAGEYGV
jgi:heat shock protein HslJ